MSEVNLGLKENWKQFVLLVIINGFVGGMVGLERSILPQLAELEFGMASRSAILSFIIAFGFTKAFTNYFTGRLAGFFGRKRLLIIGWLFAIPVPIIIIFANNWSWVVLANVLLGISQGLTWSTTVFMKIDLVGEKNRGLAMGLNEFAGYSAVGLVAFLTGYIAGVYGARPYPFYIGVFISAVGLLLSIIWVKDTGSHVSQEAKTSNLPRIDNLFWSTTFGHKTLGSVTQAGLINNLNDGMIWGLLPILLLQLKFDNQSTGMITAVYPMVWGISQLFTGKMADHFQKKRMLFGGMFLQGIAIILFIWADRFDQFFGLCFILGIGTALVYPTFLAVIAETTHPVQRAESLGVFRFWRDSGYAFGAIISGVTADILGINYAILLIGILTIASSLVIQFRIPKPTL
jgi:MFS family permease